MNIQVTEPVDGPATPPTEPPWQHPLQVAMNAAWSVVSQIASLEPGAAPHEVDQLEYTPGLYSVTLQYSEHRGAIEAFGSVYDTATETLTPHTGCTDLVARATVRGVPVTAWTRLQDEPAEPEVDETSPADAAAPMPQHLSTKAEAGA